MTQCRPYQIKEQLDEYVIGQEHVKKMMSIEFFQSQQSKKLGMPKTNILLIGPTGSGKTYLVETLAKLAKVPYYCLDAAAFTPSGYVGKSVKEAIAEAVDHLGDKSDEAIIFIDEVDKLAIRHGKDEGFKTRRVQQEFLKVMEGESFLLERKEGSSIRVDTRHMTFVFGGAFVGIEEEVEQRLRKGEDLNPATTIADLVSYGFIPEFAGRIPAIGHLSRLGVEELESILMNSKDSIYRHYERLFSAYNISLRLEPEAVTYFVEAAYQLNTGARGLNQKLGQYLRDIQYDLFLQEKLPTLVYVGMKEGGPYWKSQGIQSWEDAEAKQKKFSPGLSHGHSDAEWLNIPQLESVFNELSRVKPYKVQTDGLYIEGLSFEALKQNYKEKRPSAEKLKEMAPHLQALTYPRLSKYSAVDVMIKLLQDYSSATNSTWTRPILRLYVGLVMESLDEMVEHNLLSSEFKNSYERDMRCFLTNPSLVFQVMANILECMDSTPAEGSRLHGSERMKVSEDLMLVAKILLRYSLTLDNMRDIYRREQAA